MRIPDARHFEGDELWGDDFDDPERQAWFLDEENAYVELYASSPAYEYEYDAVNRLLGFEYLPKDRHFSKVLGLGSAFGDELAPILDRANAVVVVESSDDYTAHREFSIPLEWRKAQSSGHLPLSDAEVDLTVCLGVLHHIPNVSHVVKEIGRVTASDGYALIREPIISMGDWREPRRGLTARERGIPRKLLLQFVEDAGFDVVEERLCFFAGTPTIARLLHVNRYEQPAMIRMDALLSSLTRFNYRYHATKKWQKIRPTSTFLTLRRR